MLDPTSLVKTFSDRSFPKMSTGSPSQLSHRRFAWQFLLAYFLGGFISVYGFWVRVPRDVKLMPHRHPEDRVYTVISGIFYIGLGDQFDPDKLQAFPAGSVIILPGNTWHFHWAKSSEYITQVTAIGPLGLEYINAKDDPRNERP